MNDQSNKGNEGSPSQEIAAKHTSQFSTPKGSEESIDGGKVYTGTVIWFGASKKDGASNNTKSFGFIEWFVDGEQKPDCFCHFSNIIADEGTYRTLKKGQKVEFQLGLNNYGEVKAINVKVMG